MLIYGSFINQQGDTITVQIATKVDSARIVEVGRETSGVFFTDNPVEISSKVNDTFDHLLHQSATIRLLAKNFMHGLFCASCRDAMVNIYRGEDCLFAGFIEPQTYSQPYNDVLDEIELNCIDVLSALQYSKYKDVGSLGVLYQQVKFDAEQRTFHDIITGIFEGVTRGLDIFGLHTFRYLYDGSKAVDNNISNRYSIFKQLSISELLFLGNDEGDVWQQDRVLEEILRYLNLHIVQEGFTFYIFSWESVKGTDPISWHNLLDDQPATTVRETISIETPIAADTNTQVSIGEVFNQVQLTSKEEEIKNVIESPLDRELLYSPYDWYQKYMTEYTADGNGRSAYDAFKAMCHDQKVEYGGGGTTDWFVQVKNNKHWIFPKNGSSVDLITYFCADGTNQQALPIWLGNNPGAAILSIGKVDKATSNNDNKLVSKIESTDCLVLSVNGNKEDIQSKTYPTESVIKNCMPYAIYNGNNAGGVFSPADDKTTNYIVLSGNVILNPIMDVTEIFRVLHDTEDWSQGGKEVAIDNGHGGKIKYNLPRWWHETVPSRTNKYGRYYTRRYWKADKPLDKAVWDRAADYGLIPFTNSGPEEYEFQYSAVGDSSDTISKISVLACMLIIGDQCVVEKTPDNDLGTGVPYTGHGWPQDFVWRKYKSLAECGSEDEYYQQCFTIGFDPKIGDKLIGTEFALQTNHDYMIGIEADGIAIPIKKGDKLSGRVKFMILGPVYTTWGEVTRRHPTFFRHTKWGTATVPLLAHVSSIMLRQFEVKIHSNNGFNNDEKRNDIIYMSDTKETFVNKKDDLEFKITSALTSEERKRMGVVSMVSLSTPLNAISKVGVTDIYDYVQQEQAKPEQLYVDSYYKEYHTPRILMEQNLIDTKGIVSLFAHYLCPALDKKFFVQGISRNLEEGSANLILKEI